MAIILNIVKHRKVIARHGRISRIHKDKRRTVEFCGSVCPSGGTLLIGARFVIASDHRGVWQSQVIADSPEIAGVKAKL